MTYNLFKKISAVYVPKESYNKINTFLEKGQAFCLKKNKFFLSFLLLVIQRVICVKNKITNYTGSLFSSCSFCFIRFSAHSFQTISPEQKSSQSPKFYLCIASNIYFMPLFAKNIIWFFLLFKKDEEC